MIPADRQPHIQRAAEWLVDKPDLPLPIGTVRDKFGLSQGEAAIALARSNRLRRERA